MTGGGVSPTPPVSPFAQNPDVYAISNGQGETILALTAADGQGVVALAPRGVINEGSVGLVANNVDGLIQCETDDTITSCSDTNIAAKFLHAALPSTGQSALVTLEFESCAVESDVLDSVIAVKWNNQTVCRLRYQSDEDPVAYAYTSLINKSVYLPIQTSLGLSISGANGISLVPTFSVMQDGTTHHYALSCSEGSNGLEGSIVNVPALDVSPLQYLNLIEVSELTDRHILCEFESVSVEGSDKQIWAIKYNGETILHAVLILTGGNYRFIFGSRVLCESITKSNLQNALLNGQIVSALCNDIPLRLSGINLNQLSVQYAGSENGHVGVVRSSGTVSHEFVSKYYSGTGNVSTIESFLTNMSWGAQAIEYDADLSPFTMTKFLGV